LNPTLEGPVTFTVQRDWQGDFLRNETLHVEEANLKRLHSVQFQ
jgi:hypothetical protein